MDGKVDYGDAFQTVARREALPTFRTWNDQKKSQFTTGHSEIDADEISHGAESVDHILRMSTPPYHPSQRY